MSQLVVRRGSDVSLGQSRRRGRATKLRDTVTIGLFVAVVAVIVAIDVWHRLSPDTSTYVSLQSPSLRHPAGTDAVGRDDLNRILSASALSLYAAVTIILASVIIGGLIGAVAGFAGGWIDSILMRFTDLFLALPAPVLAIAVAGAFSPSFKTTLLSVTVVWWPLYGRIVRGEVRALRARPHVESARVSGVRGVRLVFRHVLPGATAPVLIAVSLDIGLTITTLAGLSFLGLGSPEPHPELGGMVSQNMSYLLNSWWIPIFPGVAVFVLAYLANLAGDSLRDVLGRR
jgi:peptide/nickel transport system permease protein